jgi:hypothetical protein
MVQINRPPPKILPQPVIYTLPVRSHFLRLFNPALHNPQALTFRRYGPLHRFDHHREKDGEPIEDKERGILYAGESISGCIVEVFGDTRIIEVGTWELALLETQRALILLDLRGDGAMKAGTVAGVCKDINRGLSQLWSRYFYENECIYGLIDGLLFGNAHNDEMVLALYERAESALRCLMACPLSDNALRTEVLLTATDYGLSVEPY